MRCPCPLPENAYQSRKLSTLDLGMMTAVRRRFGWCRKADREVESVPRQLTRLSGRAGAIQDKQALQLSGKQFARSVCKSDKGQHDWDLNKYANHSR